ncbi:MAG TPA: S8 family serine peptidase, partial [Pyrinomonadaceae bacterium]
MSRVPRIRVAPASRQKQLRRKLPGRTAIALAFGLAALLGLATLGASARLRSQSVGDSSGSQALSESSSSGKGSHGIEFVPGDILVRYRSNARARREEMAASQLFRNGREIPLKVQRFEGSNLVEGLRQARVQPEDTLDAIAELRADPDVLYAAPNYIRRKAVLPNDPRFGEVWALKNTGQPGTVNNATFVNGTPGADIDAELAWTNYTTGSGSVVVGIIDTGIDVGHPDLVDNIWVNPGEVANDGIDNDGNGKIDDINGWDFAHNDKTVFDGGINDPDDHGTHVAGTIGAKGNNGVGVAGINWDVKLMSLKFLTGKDGFGTDTSAIAAFTYAKMMRDRGVNLRVLNCSWGSAGSNPAVKDAIDSVGESGILVVAAAGNAWTDNDDFPEYPASFDSPNLVRVSATDRVDDLAEFSNFGTRVPGIGAPGRGILSTTPRNYPTAQATYKEPDGSTYTFFSGTSMATPQVSGVAALLLAQYPGLSVQRLRGALLYSGEVLPSLLDKVTTGRRLNAKLALDNAALNDTTPPTISGLSLVAQNGRNLTLQFATGDDGTSGNAALYDVYFTTPANLKYHLGSFLPTGAGNPQSISVLAPYKQTTGTLTLYVIDDAGNIASSNVAVTLNSAPFEPYAISLSAASPLSAGGDPLSLSADDKYKRNYALPFDFPFYGKVMKKVTISTNGALYFSAPLTRVNGDADDVFNDLNEKRAMLNLQSMIAGMWDDLRTDRFSGDVFVTKDADHIIFRWQGSTFASDTDPINFEIELRRDGTIQMRYGSGNTGLKPLVGISGGQTDAFLGGPEDAYVISSHSQPSVNALTNAQTVTFTPQAATPVCTYSISPTTRNIGSDSAGGTIAVTAGAGCAWTATSNDSFIIITSSASGTGNGNVSYSLPANTSTTPRTGTINIAGQTFTVTQAGVAPPVQLGVTSPGISESQGFVTITVNRSGDLSGPTTVKYATSDTTDANFRCDPNTPGQTTGVASRKCDYHIAVGTLRFAAGET